ncbi:hypothetical protein DLAC_04169 [Tieghemostelium lacteum]|uniref:Nucleolar complex protein 2 homolog n=1 Tax=Tieghemostelium lacteum TaxID=361077 RepID=A0A151ZSE3_TIELA|nr:hypothetical protein DLAC_04169 [Tieghemostelium lacteum]|eukprot:KYQ96862.1 hypothetical protein DLAC_04169 [Tieghemostelium lacteum]
MVGKVKKSTKKFDFKTTMKQKKHDRKVKKDRAVSEKSQANFREEESEEEENFDLEDKKEVKNTKIVNQEENSDDDIDMDDIEEDDDEEDSDDDESQLKIEKDSKDIENLKKKDSKEKVKDSEKTTQLKGQVKSHKDDLRKLQEQDPKLFEFLSAEDKKILEDEDDDDELESDDDLENGDGEEGKGEKKTAVAKQDVMTSALLDSWLKECQKQNSVYNMKKLVIAFRSAARTGLDLSKNSETQYKITHSEIFHRVLIICLQNLPEFFDKFLEYDSEKQEETTQGGRQPELPKSNPKWKLVQFLVNSYLKSLLQLTMQINDAKMLLILLKGVEKCSIYISSHSNKIANMFLKNLLQHWSGSNESVRVMAFLCIRKLAIFTPYPFIESCLKGVYLNFVRNAKFINTVTLPIVNFMCNCVVEIFGIDFASSYKLAFQFIRQLAIHLRNTLNNTKDKQSVQNIYNWQFINSIRAWVEVISAYPKQEFLQLLIYPISQILVGVIGLIPSAKFYPLRFTCVRLLNKLAETNQVFINTIPYLLETLEAHAIGKQYGSRPTGSRTKFLNFYTALSVNPAQMKTKEFQDGIANQFMELIVENLNSHCCSIGYPELCTPLLLHLQKYLKSHQKAQTKLITDIQELVEAIKKSSKMVKDQRDKVNFSPKDTKQVREFSERLREQLKSNPMNQLFVTIKARSKRIQKTLIESDKVYNYEDDEEEPQSDEEEENQDDVEMEDVEDEEDEDEEEETFDDDQEEEKSRPIKKKKNIPSGSNDGEDLVEDLILSD